MTQLLLAFHGTIALLVKSDIWEIDEDEAKRMTAAYERLSRHYPSLQRVSPKTVDHLNAGSVLCGIYGTRIIAAILKARASKEQQHRGATPVPPRPVMTPAGPVSAQPAHAPPNVTPIRPANPVNPPKADEIIPYGL